MSTQLPLTSRAGRAISFRKRVLDLFSGGHVTTDLFRMRQFYDTYRNNKIVSPLVRQLSWTHNLIILSQSKREEEREFYLRLSIKENWSKRELERQFRTALFERIILHPVKVSAVLTQIHPEALNIFKDSYLVEFLGLPEGHDESDPHKVWLGWIGSEGLFNSHVATCNGAGHCVEFEKANMVATRYNKGI